MSQSSSERRCPWFQSRFSSRGLPSGLAVALAILCTQPLGAIGADKAEGASKDAPLIKIFFGQHEVGKTTITLDASGRAEFSHRGKSSSVALDADDAKKMLDLAIKAHAKLRKPKGNENWSDTTSVELEVQAPGQKPLKFKGGSFMFRDELPKDLVNLIESLNNHFDKQSRFDFDWYLHRRERRTAPR